MPPHAAASGHAGTCPPLVGSPLRAAGLMGWWDEGRLAAVDTGCRGGVPIRGARWGGVDRVGTVAAL